MEAPAPAPLEPVQELADIRDRLIHLFDEIDQGTLDEIAHRLDVVFDIVQRATGMSAVLQMNLAERMENDTIQVRNLGWVQRKQKRSNAGSDWEGARVAAKGEIIHRVALDIATGEVRLDWKAIATQTLELLDRTLALGYPKRAGMASLGLNYDEFVSSSNAGWEVKIEKGALWTEG